LIESVAEREVGEKGREGINNLIKRMEKREVGKRARE
jgi:hypothetical protein